MRPTYSKILGKKTITPDDRKSFDSKIPSCRVDNSGFVDLSSTGVDRFFLYGAMTCGELHPCRSGAGQIMVSASELMEALKQDRYAYKSLAERRLDQVVILVVILSLSIAAIICFVLFAR